eukprot:COSAG01_NODE_10178_length_2229_cov_4.487793_1_plen_185_part_00
MHSDGAAAAAVQQLRGRRGGQKTAALGASGGIDERMAAACAAEKPFDALYSLARALRDEGVRQQALYDLFDRYRASHTADADERLFDALCDTLDYVCGWCRIDHPMQLFPHNSLPQTQSRAREWASARTQRVTEAAEAEVQSTMDSTLTTASHCWIYAQVAAFALAVLGVHGAIAFTLTTVLGS